MPSNIILTICLGALAGLCSGSLGQSGAEIMIPGLLLLNIVADYRTAIGTVLLTITPPYALLAVIEYYKRGQVNISISALLFTSFFFTAVIGAYINKYLSLFTIEIISGFYLLLASMFYFWRAYNNSIK
jgi:uncharacterized membrane protein YfcA